MAGGGGADFLVLGSYSRSQYLQIAALCYDFQNSLMYCGLQEDPWGPRYSQ